LLYTSGMVLGEHKGKGSLDGFREKTLELELDLVG
jgi:hypothetical protein